MFSVPRFFVTDSGGSEIPGQSDVRELRSGEEILAGTNSFDSVANGLTNHLSLVSFSPCNPLVSMRE